MSFSYKHLSAVVLATASFGAPVFAQDLAQEVVNEYFDEMRASGMAVAPGAKDVSGTTVEWRDVVIGLPDAKGSYTLAFIKAEEIGGGKVSISYPDEVIIKIDPEGEQPKMDMVLRTDGVEHIVSGVKGARNHDMAADKLTVMMSSAEPVFSLNIDASDIVGHQVSSGAEMLHYKGDFKVAGLDVTYSLDDGKTQMSTVGNYSDLAADFDMDAISKETLGQLFDGTRNVSVNYTMGSVSGTTDMTTPDMAMIIDTKGGSTVGTLTVQDGTFDMGGTAQNVAYNAKLKNMPLPPFSAEMENMTTHLKMPLKKADTAMPARLQLGFDGLTVSDTVWGMFDPTGALPREAALLNIDLTAQVKWLIDALNAPEAKSMPIEVDSVEINDISLELAGAKLNGTGSAVVNNASFPPMPVGELNLDLKGGVGLLDKLVALGLVPQQQGQMVKMMSGMFTVPGGDGADHLISKIEMKEGGAILANGQRIQ